MEIARLWTENIAKLSNQLVAMVASCLAKIIDAYFWGAEELIVWSSSLGGQKRNFIFATFCLKLLVDFPKREEITHSLPISRHPFLTHDKDFGNIETKRKKKDALFSVALSICIMRWCKKTNPLKSTEMES